MIALTRAGDGKKIYVNPKQICVILPEHGEEATIVQFPGSSENYVAVLESAETVFTLVDRWMDYWKM